jgi:hypothetical protein
MREQRVYTTMLHDVLNRFIGLSNGGGASMIAPFSELIHQLKVLASGQLLV